jgi:hypothetical protein
MEIPWTFALKLQQNPVTSEVISHAFYYARPFWAVMTVVTLWIDPAVTNNVSARSIFFSLFWKLSIIAVIILVGAAPLIFAGTGFIIYVYIFIMVLNYFFFSLLFSLGLIFLRHHSRRYLLMLFGIVIAISLMDVGILAAEGFCVRTDQRCHGKKAVESDNISACYEGIGYIAWCIWDFAVAHKDPSICEEHLEGDSAVICLMKVAEHAKDIGICKRISSSTYGNLLSYRMTCCAEVLGAESEYTLTNDQLTQCGLKRFGGTMIEIESSPSSPSETASSPSPESVAFQNTKYSYTLHHPSHCVPSSNDYGVLDASNASNVSICNLQIDPQDPTLYDNQYPAMNLPLREFATHVWQLNVNDANPSTAQKKVGRLIQTSLANTPVYQFTFDTSYTDDRGGEVVSEERVALIFSHGKMNFIAFYDFSDAEAKASLESLQFE